MGATNAIGFLRTQSEITPELLGDYQQMEDLYLRKQWHQLTVLLEAFSMLPAASNHLVPLYEAFVKEFKHKLNKLALARLQVSVAQRHEQPESALSFCRVAADEASMEDKQASTYI